MNCCHPKKIWRGFTLLEILVALFVFTIVSVIMVSALHNVLTTQSRTENNSRYFDALQTSLTLLSRDLAQSINRQTTNATGLAENAFIGTPTTMTFTHAGLFNPFGQLNRSTLQRTSYYVADNNLIRETWSMLDVTSHTKSSERTLLSKVTRVQFQYVDQYGKLQTNWPPGGQTQTPLPHAVRIILSLQTLGNISQLILLPGFNNAPQH